MVADELMQSYGQQIYAHQGSMFELRIEITVFISDYPAIEKVLGSGAYKGFMWCDISGA